MGLGLKSFENTLEFVKENPKVLLLTLLLALTYFPITLFQEIAPSSFLLVMILVSLPLFIFFSILIAGTFPVLVYNGLKHKKVEIKRAISISLRNFGKILITSIIFVGMFASLFSIPLVLLVFGVLFNSISLLIISIIFIIIFTIFGIIITFRLSLVVPILVIEKRGIIESIKESWKITKGYVLSIFVASFLLNLISIAITLPFGLLNVFFNYFGFEKISLLMNGIITVINQTLSLTFFNTLFSIFYFRLKKQF